MSALAATTPSSAAPTPAPRTDPIAIDILSALDPPLVRPTRSATRCEPAPVPRSSRDPNDANWPDICAVGNEGRPRAPESVGRGPELRSMATHLRHPRQQVERTEQVVEHALGDDPTMSLMDLEEDVFEIPLSRSGELVARRHSPLRRRSSIRRRTSATASRPSRSSPRSSAATPSAIWARSSSR